MHESTPKLPSIELQNYQDVLRDAAASWLPDGDHELVIIFRAD